LWLGLQSRKERIVSSASITSSTREKQVLLGYLLQDPKHSWLQYLDDRQALGVCILLHLGKLRV
jgi:hypothetical protein